VCLDLNDQLTCQASVYVLSLVNPLSLKIASGSTLALMPAMIPDFQNILVVNTTGSRLAWTASSLSKEAHFLGGSWACGGRRLNRSQQCCTCLRMVAIQRFQLLNAGLGSTWGPSCGGW